MKKVNKILFLMIFNITLNSKPVQLSNPYNKCYENNILQAFYNLEPVNDFLRKKFGTDYYIKDSIAGKYLQSLQDYNLAQEGEFGPLKNSFCQSMTDISLQTEGQLEITDAKNFLGVLLNHLLFKDLNKNSIKEYYPFPFNKLPKTDLSDLFSTVIVNYRLSEKFDKKIRVNLARKFAYMIKLPIEKNSLDLSLDKAFLQRKSIIKVPEILILRLVRWDRFENNKPVDKNYKAVEFPINNLNLSKYIDKEAPANQNPIYDLVSIIMHHDISDKYTSYVYSDNKWYFCNDTSIVEVPESTIEKIAKQKDLKVDPTPYILIYQKRPNTINISYKKRIDENRLISILKGLHYSDEDIDKYLKTKGLRLEDLVYSINIMFSDVKSILQDMKDTKDIIEPDKDIIPLDKNIINLIKLKNYIENLSII